VSAEREPGPARPDLDEAPGGQLSFAGGLPVVRPAVEIDVTNADALRAAIMTAAQAGPDAVVVDMTETAFCGSTGLSVLVRAHKQMESQGAQLRVVTSEPTLLRIFTVTGIATMFHMFASLDDALSG
jgi:anti-sigma B factor antagonist